MRHFIALTYMADAALAVDAGYWATAMGCVLAAVLCATLVVRKVGGIWFWNVGRLGGSCFVKRAS